MRDSLSVCVLYRQRAAAQGAAVLPRRRFLPKGFRASRAGGGRHGQTQDSARSSSESAAPPEFKSGEGLEFRVQGLGFLRFRVSGALGLAFIAWQLDCPFGGVLVGAPTCSWAAVLMLPVLLLACTSVIR